MWEKGQLAPDYLVTIVFLGIIALVAFGAYGHMQQQAFSTIERAYAKDLAERITGAINSVVIMGDGAQKSITLESTLGGREYNLTLRANAVLVRWHGLDQAARFSTASINGTEVTLDPGEILIKNMNGIVYLEQVG